MGLEFRRRNYRAEEQAHSLPRTPVNTHPLSAPRSLPLQVKESDSRKDDFVDPLRAADASKNVSTSDMGEEGDIFEEHSSLDMSAQLKAKKDWIFFKKILLQRFPASKTTPMSLVSSVLFRDNKVEKSSKYLPSEEWNDHTKFDEEEVKVISQQECLSNLQELKDEINRSWRAGDRVTSLRLSIKVARLLMDASIIQFYPTLFVLATDIFDMLGELVWNRVKQKAEITDEGESICSLPDNFKATDICFDAKETCNNWFNKIGSVYELLPRIYLELAILHCWRFLHDHPENKLQRLVMMTRGIADPLASAYCRLYLVQCAQRLPQHDTGSLITCINDLKLLLMRLTMQRETMSENVSGKSELLLNLIEPTIEYITRCLFKDKKQMEINDMLVALGMWRNLSVSSEGCYCISIILHYVLKELPVRFICSNAMDIMKVIECTNDSTFVQHLNLNLLGHRLCERIPEVSNVNLVLDKIMQVLPGYNNLDAYLMVVDAYLDMIMDNHLDNLLKAILAGIFVRMQEANIGENELVMLESIFLKYLTHFSNIESIISLDHFVEILDMMHGRSRNSVNMQILNMATRNGQIRDPTVIEVLFELAQALYEGLDFSNMRKDDNQHPSHVISRFVYMVGFGTDVESQLKFLGQCRGAFSCISELQEILVHSCNNLAVQTMKDGRSSITFVKSCLAFNEVTIPAIPTNLRQLRLYLATAEVALLGGFISHLDGLIDAAVHCFQNIDGGPPAPEEVDLIVSLMCKLCGMLVVVPGNPEQGLACIPKHILSFLDSRSWILPRMKTKVLSAVIFLSAALSQDELLYHAASVQVLGNHQLLHGVQLCHQELLSLSAAALQDILNITVKEPSMVVRGKMALEACTCVASSFALCDETLEACSKLVEIAISCLGVGDKFLQSTLMFMDSHYGFKPGKPF
ncbi:uncharacterized protein LOC127247563 isoform X2 [Andrographis paniculata]|uniref:uncharacterized protein LOC127247563 isoform X2 n=1 Tax=Andrographis paniculata TaxID=175694 RepID=UPI0021E84C97|nr:uncharacterized protein LOC127247563 isoform X2 [Andrographis paniculata]